MSWIFCKTSFRFSMAFIPALVETLKEKHRRVEEKCWIFNVNLICCISFAPWRRKPDFKWKAWRGGHCIVHLKLAEASLMGIYGEEKCGDFRKVLWESFTEKFYGKVFRKSFTESFTEKFYGKVFRKSFTESFTGKFYGKVLQKVLRESFTGKWGARFGLRLGKVTDPPQVQWGSQFY